MRVFVGSMGDIFHEDIDIADRECVFWEFSKYPQHTFLLLTKRPDGNGRRMDA
jgi:protein gp37